MKLRQITGEDHEPWPVEDRVLWLTCDACGGTGSIEKSHPFPDDPEFCETNRCEECGGSGRLCR